MRQTVDNNDMERVSHHGRVTAYRHTDRSPSSSGVVFVHGSGATQELWSGQRELTSRYPVVTLDLSGHGESTDIDATAGYATLSAYVDDVLAVLDATGSSVLVGNSLGGAVVMTALLEREPPVEAAVLTGTGGRLGVLDDLLEWLQTDFERAVDFLHGPDRLFHDPDPTVRDRSIATMRACGREVTYRDFLTCHRFDVRDRLGEITVPTLVVYGEHDQLTPPWFHEYLADELANATLAEIEDAAHLAMVERRQVFNEALATFLDETLE